MQKRAGSGRAKWSNHGAGEATLQTEAASTRACLQLSRMIAQASWTPARKFRASLS